MKIVLIIPPYADYLTSPAQQTSLGVLYVSSFLKSGGHEVLVADLSNHTLYSAIKAVTSNEFYSNFLSYGVDVVGFTATALDYSNCVELSKVIRQVVGSGVRIVLGGPHTSLARLEILSREDSSVFNDLFFGEIEGLNYNINHIPFPDRAAIPSNGMSDLSIFAGGVHYKGTKSATIITSRGCPHNCAFCASGNSGYRRFRMRSAENVGSEIKELVYKYNVHQFRIQDDNIALDKSRFLSLMPVFKDLNIFWRASARVDSIDSDVLQEAYLGGCRELGFGIESADEVVIKLLNKKLNLDKAKQVIKMTKSVGIKVRLFFMVSAPGETQKTIEDNIKFIEETSPDIVTCASFVPFPGTPVWSNPEKYGIKILDKDFTSYKMALYDEDVAPSIKLLNISTDQMYNNRALMRKFLFDNGHHNKG